MTVKLIKKLDDFLRFRNGLEQPPGVVMTMGNLHEGHRSLVEKARSNHANVIVTIFVNPKQFGPQEDFNLYPRTLEQDLRQLQELKDQNPQGTLTIFAPETNEDIYPLGFSTYVKVNGITDGLCGKSRPGHFEGVTTVVCRLLNLSRPACAYFGQKDYQQFKVIEKMVFDLGLPYQIECCPIIRDRDGLALSSRNQYLTAIERERALELPKTLEALETLICTHQSLTPAWELIKSKAHFEYLEILDANNLQEVTKSTVDIVLLGALKVGKTRLIDNRLILGGLHVRK